MNELELRFPQWQAPFQELIIEFTLQRVPEALQKAEALVHERLQQLDHGNNHRDEKMALQDAMAVIRVLSEDLHLE
jgi:hypothetical protein